MRPIPEAYEIVLLQGDDASLVWELNDTMTKFAAALSPCKLTRLGKAVTLGYFRGLDLSVLDAKGDYL